MKKLILAVALVFSSTTWANSVTDAVTSTLINAIVIKHALDTGRIHQVDPFLGVRPRHNHVDRRNIGYQRPYLGNHNRFSRCAPTTSYYHHRDYIVVTHRDTCTGRLISEKRIPK